ncbi:transcription/translation regulatory transformer protein RfaH [Vibrio sinaloensis]|uniref:transcription/translation regulatory transformer protein RfaH n=1 Tax=Photobacterium sp. (strain ATCC 43367) TaxID=379097 RepID=UPI00057D78CF|nr:transcription/translation regulatory transformer protein RfaH [Vibrio sinaloensis]KHT46307.1 transcriptional regulator [Vibrio sinaloensis]
MKQWYLLYCKRSEQQRAKMHLENQGVECYYPEIQIEKMVRGKRQVKKEPLFPSYIFARFDVEQGPTFTTIRSTRGVVDFVRRGALPQILQGDLIVTLKDLETEREGLMQAGLPEKGDTVNVATGQFAGMEAIYQEPDGERRSILLVNMLSKQVEVTVDNKDLDLQ